MSPHLRTGAVAPEKQAGGRRDAGRLQRGATPAHPQLQGLGAVIEQIPIGIALTRPNGEIEYLNPYLGAIIGLGGAQAAGIRLCAFRLGASPYQLRRVRRQLLCGNPWQGETQIKQSTGETFHALESVFALRGSGGAITHFIHFLQDIGGRKLADTICKLAFYDGLTGLPNRNLLHERLNRAIAGAKRAGDSFALMYIDIDRFKQVNDTLGHDAGDKLLRTVASRLRDSLRESDTLARLGGDEFVAILEHIHEPGALVRIAGKLLATCLRPCDLRGAGRNITVSIGISVYPRHAQSAEALLKCADSAMYKAKAAGGNACCVA